MSSSDPLTTATSPTEAASRPVLELGPLANPRRLRLQVPPVAPQDTDRA